MSFNTLYLNLNIVIQLSKLRVIESTQKENILQFNFIHKNKYITIEFYSPNKYNTIQFYSQKIYDDLCAIFYIIYKVNLNTWEKL